MPTGKEIAERALIPLNEKWGYIWGKSGQIWTAEAQAKATREMTIKYGSRWIGKRVCDCSGLVVWILSHYGIRVPHGSNSMYKNGYMSERGALPRVLPMGALVFKAKDDDMHHEGVYIGSGWVVEAYGTQKGVIKSTIDSGWTHYGLIKGVDYGSTEDVKPQKEEKTLNPGRAIVDVPNDGTVNIRASNSTKSKKIRTIREGEPVDVLSVSGEWAKVRYTRTIEDEGYVKTEFLRTPD